MDKYELENLIRLAPKPYVPDKLPLQNYNIVNPDIFRQAVKLIKN